MTDVLPQPPDAAALDDDWMDQIARAYMVFAFNDEVSELGWRDWLDFWTPAKRRAKAEKQIRNEEGEWVEQRGDIDLPGAGGTAPTVRANIGGEEVDEIDLPDHGGVKGLINKYILPKDPNKRLDVYEGWTQEYEDWFRDHYDLGGDAPRVPVPRDFESVEKWNKVYDDWMKTYYDPWYRANIHHWDENDPNKPLEPLIDAGQAAASVDQPATPVVPTQQFQDAPAPPGLLERIGLKTPYIRRIFLRRQVREREKFNQRYDDWYKRQTGEDPIDRPEPSSHASAKELKAWLANQDAWEAHYQPWWDENVDKYDPKDPPPPLGPRTPWRQGSDEKNYPTPAGTPAPAGGAPPKPAPWWKRKAKEWWDSLDEDTGGGGGGRPAGGGARQPAGGGARKPGAGGGARKPGPPNAGKPEAGELKPGEKRPGNGPNGEPGNWIQPEGGGDPVFVPAPQGEGFLPEKGEERPVDLWDGRIIPPENIDDMDEDWIPGVPLPEDPTERQKQLIAEAIRRRDAWLAAIEKRKKLWEIYNNPQDHMDFYDDFENWLARNPNMKRMFDKSGLPLTLEGKREFLASRVLYSQRRQIGKDQKKPFVNAMNQLADELKIPEEDRWWNADLNDDEDIRVVPDRATWEAEQAALREAEEAEAAEGEEGEEGTEGEGAEGEGDEGTEGEEGEAGGEGEESGTAPGDGEGEEGGTTPSGEEGETPTPTPKPKPKKPKKPKKPTAAEVDEKIQAEAKLKEENGINPDYQRQNSPDQLWGTNGWTPGAVWRGPNGEHIFLENTKTNNPKWVAVDKDGNDLGRYDTPAEAQQAINDAGAEDEEGEGTGAGEGEGGEGAGEGAGEGEGGAGEGDEDLDPADNPGSNPAYEEWLKRLWDIDPEYQRTNEAEQRAQGPAGDEGVTPNRTFEGPNGELIFQTGDAGNKKWAAIDKDGNDLGRYDSSAEAQQAINDAAAGGGEGEGGEGAGETEEDRVAREAAEAEQAEKDQAAQAEKDRKAQEAKAQKAQKAKEAKDRKAQEAKDAKAEKDRVAQAEKDRVAQEAQAEKDRIAQEAQAEKDRVARENESDLEGKERRAREAADAAKEARGAAAAAEEELKAEQARLGEKAAARRQAEADEEAARKAAVNADLEARGEPSEGWGAVNLFEVDREGERFKARVEVDGEQRRGVYGAEDGFLLQRLEGDDAGKWRAHDPDGNVVGDYDSLAEAEAAVDAQRSQGVGKPVTRNPSKDKWEPGGGRKRLVGRPEDQEVFKAKDNAQLHRLKGDKAGKWRAVAPGNKDLGEYDSLEAAEAAIDEARNPKEKATVAQHEAKQNRARAQLLSTAAEKLERQASTTEAEINGFINEIEKLEKALPGYSGAIKTTAEKNLKEYKEQLKLAQLRLPRQQEAAVGPRAEADRALTVADAADQRALDAANYSNMAAAADKAEAKAVRAENAAKKSQGIADRAKAKAAEEGATPADAKEAVQAQQDADAAAAEAQRAQADADIKNSKVEEALEEAVASDEKLKQEEANAAAPGNQGNNALADQLEEQVGFEPAQRAADVLRNPENYTKDEIAQILDDYRPPEKDEDDIELEKVQLGDDYDKVMATEKETVAALEALLNGTPAATPTPEPVAPAPQAATPAAPAAKPKATPKPAVPAVEAPAPAAPATPKPAAPAVKPVAPAAPRRPAAKPAAPAAAAQKPTSSAPEVIGGNGKFNAAHYRELLATEKGAALRKASDTELDDWEAEVLAPGNSDVRDAIIAERERRGLPAKPKQEAPATPQPAAPAKPQPVAPAGRSREEFVEASKDHLSPTIKESAAALADSSTPPEKLQALVDKNKAHIARVQKDLADQENQRFQQLIDERVARFGPGWLNNDRKKAVLGQAKQDLAKKRAGVDNMVKAYEETIRHLEGAMGGGSPAVDEIDLPEGLNPAIELGASKAHDEYRNGFLLPDGTREVRMRPVNPKDPDNKEMVDINNTPYEDLPPHWKEQNRGGARGAENAVQAVEAQTGEPFDPSNPEHMEAAAEAVHVDWLERNSWRDDIPEDQQKPYGEMTDDNKELDRGFVRNALKNRELAAQASAPTEPARPRPSFPLLRNPTYPTLQGSKLQRFVKDDGSLDVAGVQEYLKNNEVVGLDFETTGVDVTKRFTKDPSNPTDRPTQVGVIPFKGGERSGDGYESLANPGKPIHPDAARITGISDTDVADAPNWAEQVPTILEAIGDKTVIAQNGAFDIELIKDMIDTIQNPDREGELPEGIDVAALRQRLTELGATDKDWTPSGGVIDSLAMARATHGEGRNKAADAPKNNKLSTMAEHYGIPSEGAHDASADVKMALGVLEKLLEKAGGDGKKIPVLQQQKYFEQDVRKFPERLKEHLAALPGYEEAMAEWEPLRDRKLLEAQALREAGNDSAADDIIAALRMNKYGADKRLEELKGKRPVTGTAAPLGHADSRAAGLALRRAMPGPAYRDIVNLLLLHEPGQADIGEVDKARRVLENNLADLQDRWATATNRAGYDDLIGVVAAALNNLDVVLESDPNLRKALRDPSLDAEMKSDLWDAYGKHKEAQRSLGALEAEADQLLREHQVLVASSGEVQKQDQIMARIRQIVDQSDAKRGEIGTLQRQLDFYAWLSKNSAA